MIIANILDLLPFLAYLRGRGIKASLSQQRDDTVMVSFTLVGARVEVDFFSDHVEFSYFTGDESVEDDIKKLIKVIDKHWD